MKTFWKAALATGVYAAVHSLLAAERTKEVAARHLGRRNRAGLYRPFYIAQSLVTFAGLVLYIRRLPRHEVYRIEGTPAAVMRIGQGGALVWATLTAGSVGFGDITGLRNLVRWATGRAVQPEPEAQGPTLAENGEMHVTGPFRLSRHPLNVAPLGVFWLQPVVTTRMLGFNVAASAYLVLGSLHEEWRLGAAYGAPYRRYVNSGVPFYVPGLPAGTSSTRRVFGETSTT